MKVLSITEVCERYGVRKAAVRKAVKKGGFPAPIRNGRCWRWPDLAAWEKAVHEKNHLQYEEQEG